jgi:hypothetical protein
LVDVLDVKQYPKLEMPVLGLASINYEGLKASLEPKASNVRMVKVKNGGHFFPEEQPEATHENSPTSSPGPDSRGTFCGEPRGATPLLIASIKGYCARTPRRAVGKRGCLRFELVL